MAFVTHEQAIERTLVLVEGERGETATHLVLLVAARMLAAEVRRLRGRLDDTKAARDGAMAEVRRLRDMRERARAFAADRGDAAEGRIARHILGEA